MIPTDAFATHLESVVPEGTSVYPAPASQILAPAVVLRPDNPWIANDEATYCLDHQRYVAVAVVRATSPESGMMMLYDMVQVIKEDLPAGWRWDSTGAPVLDESTGTALLAASVRLSYLRTEELEES